MNIITNLQILRDLKAIQEKIEEMIKPACKMEVLNILAKEDLVWDGLICLGLNGTPMNIAAIKEIRKYLDCPLVDARDIYNNLELKTSEVFTYRERVRWYLEREGVLVAGRLVPKSPSCAIKLIRTRFRYTLREATDILEELIDENQR